MISRSECCLVSFKFNDYKTELLLVQYKYRQMPPLLPVVVGNEMIMSIECADDYESTNHFCLQIFILSHK